jgi:hypothetical protein
MLFIIQLKKYLTSIILVLLCIQQLQENSKMSEMKTVTYRGITAKVPEWVAYIATGEDGASIWL